MMNLKDREKLYDFLLGLDADLSTIRTQILAMNPTPTLSMTYHLASKDDQ